MWKKVLLISYLVFCSLTTASMIDVIEIRESTDGTLVKVSDTSLNETEGTVINQLETNYTTVNIENTTLNETTATNSTWNNNGTTSNNTTEIMTPNGTFPFQASVYLNYNDKFICGGQIITNNLILTVASCLYYEWGGVLPPVIVKVLVGRTTLNESTAYNLEASNIIFHPEFDKATLVNNLAIIQISNALNFNSAVKNATVKKSTTDGTYTTCFTTGWNKVSHQLQSFEVSAVNCSQSYFSSQMCAQPKLNNETACNFSKGSSLVCDGELVGVLSATPTCNSSTKYAVYERISSAVSWLKSNNAFSSATNLEPFSINKASVFHSVVLIVYVLASVLIRSLIL